MSSYCNINVSKTGVIVTLTPQRKGKESKEKKRKTTTHYI
jgi:hypothetical protein